MNHFKTKSASWTSNFQREVSALKKWSLVLSLFLLAIGLVGCGMKEEAKVGAEAEADAASDADAAINETAAPAITGEITEIKDGRFLVISESKKLSDVQSEAIWFSTDELDTLEVGQMVSVWTTLIEESYPGQASAEKIEIIEE